MAQEEVLARPPVALVVSEHEWSTLSLESVLGPNGYAVLRAFNGRQALERAQTLSPDVVFIDSRLPDMDGVQLCRVLRQHPNVSLSTPILLVTADYISRPQQLGALRAGAWDFIKVPMDAEELLLRLESYIRAKLDADRAREESLLDQATGLYSVRGVLRRARELASDATRHSRPLACIVVAPETGSTSTDDTAAAVIELMVGVFRSGSRVSDAVGRMGPSEFVLLAPETGEEGARRLAQRLAEATEALNRSRPDEPPLKVRIGCYAVDDFRQAAIEPVELLTRATLAVRNAKADPNGIHFYQTPPLSVN